MKVGTILPSIAILVGELIILFISILLLYGCNKDDSINETQEQDFGTKNVSVSINLPENSTLNLSDLTVSSLFTFNNKITDGESTVELFNGSHPRAFGLY